MTTTLPAPATDAAEPGPDSATAADNAHGMAMLMGTSHVGVTGITATPSASGPLGVGQSVTFALATERPVTVTGSPVLTLGNGATATYVASASTPTSLAFRYAVGARQRTTDLQVTGLALGGATVSVPSSLGFAPATTSAAGAYPGAATVADLNGDGLPDLVLKYFSGGAASVGGVSVLLGTGGGSFATAATYAAGRNPTSVAVADLNGDGRPDLVVGDQNGATGTASVLLGQGNGSFGTAATYAAGSFPAYPNSVALADVNGDGKPDLVAASASYSAMVLLGQGNGAFGAATTYGLQGVYATQVAVADVNGDGRPDLVVMGSYGAVAVLLGTGNGSFGPAATYAVGSLLQAVAVADLNGDGRPDLAVADYGTYDSATNGYVNGGLAVLLGTGGGSFGTATTYAAVHLPVSVSVSDLDGDGKPDLVAGVSGDYNPNTQRYTGAGVSVLLGTGGGSFGPATLYGTRSTVISATVADLDGDGRPDVVATVGGGDDTLVVLNRSLAPGTFDATSVASAPGRDTGLAVDTRARTDLNGDGTSDVLLQSGGTVVDWTMGGGRYQSGNVLATGAAGFAVVGHGDLNGDGTSDVLLQSSDGSGVVDWIVQNGRYQVGNAVAAGLSGFRVVGTGDFNGDGTDDVLLQSNDGGTVVQWTMKDGKYQSGSVVATGLSGYKVVGAGDMNGDGTSDILLQSNDGSVVLDWTMRNGAYQSGNTISTAAAGYNVVGTGDFNGDGTDDVLLQSKDGGTVVDWIMAGGKYASGNVVGTGAAGYKVVGTGDYDGDGTADVLLQAGGTVVDWTVQAGKYASGSVVATGAIGYSVV